MDIFDTLYDDIEDDALKHKSDVLSVSELTGKIKNLLETEIGFVRVKGELSNFKLSPSGHTYFNLKDADASIQCVMFKRSRSFLNFAPEDGMVIEIVGNISVYEPRGQYQLIVEFMQKAGVGDLFKAFNELKEKLEKEGLFDQSHKKPIPFLPRKIGVITSPTGAAIRDILNVIKRRFANVEVIIYPVLVQGEKAGGEIAHAIKKLNERKLVDVIIAGRGGGSIEDLWAFNEEIVARAIYDSQIPIISAVGHETDFTIADFVADLRAPTPSAAAELVTQNQREVLEKVAGFDSSLDLAMSNIVSHLKLRLEKASKSYALQSPIEKYHRFQQRLDEMIEKLNFNFANILLHKKHGINLLNQKLIALSPTAILERGYSIVFKDGTSEIVKSPAQVQAGNELRIKSVGGDYKAKII